MTVLHVLPQISATYPGTKVLAKAFQDEMKKLLPAEAECGCHPDFDVELGDPVETILKVAKERQADLIIMGVRRAQPLASHLEADTAYRVVAAAECPVLTVRNSVGGD